VGGRGRRRGKSNAIPRQGRKSIVGVGKQFLVEREGGEGMCEEFEGEVTEGSLPEFKDELRRIRWEGACSEVLLDFLLATEEKQLGEEVKTGS